MKIQPDWWTKTLSGALLGWTLAIALSGVFAWLTPGGIAATEKTQLVMWMIAPLWMAAFALVYLAPTGRQGVVWLLGANILAYTVLLCAKGFLSA